MKLEDKLTNELKKLKLLDSDYHCVKDSIKILEWALNLSNDVSPSTKAKKIIKKSTPAIQYLIDHTYIGVLEKFELRIHGKTRRIYDFSKVGYDNYRQQSDFIETSYPFEVNWVSAGFDKKTNTHWVNHWYNNKPIMTFGGDVFIENGPDDWIAKETKYESMGGF